jgi:hypothetical protein
VRFIDRTSCDVVTCSSVTFVNWTGSWPSFSSSSRPFLAEIDVALSSDLLRRPASSHLDQGDTIPCALSVEGVRCESEEHGSGNLFSRMTAANLLTQWAKPALRR